MPLSKAEPQTTTNQWQDLSGSLLEVRSSGIYSYNIKCTVASSKFRVLAANDENFTIYEIDEPETIISKDQMVGVGGPAFYMFYKIQIMEDAVGGKVEAYGASK